MIVAAIAFPASALRAVIATRIGRFGSPPWLTQVATSLKAGAGTEADGRLLARRAALS